MAQLPVSGDQPTPEDKRLIFTTVVLCVGVGGAGGPAASLRGSGHTRGLHHRQAVSSSYSVAELGICASAPMAHDP